MASEGLMVLSVSQAREKNYCIISFDDESTIKLHIDIVSLNKIKKGRNIYKSELEQLLAKQRLTEAKLKAYQYAAGKNKTEFMIVRNLQQKGFSKEETNAAIEYLREYNITDDFEFCRKFIEICITKKASGKIKIAGELMKRGVSKNIIENALNTYFPEEGVYELAMKAAEKKLRLLANKPIEKQKSSLANSLRNSGFPNSVIRQVIQSMEKDSGR